MAELMVERKKKSTLPWLLIALLILGVLGYLVWRNYDTAEQPTNTTTTTEQTTTTAPSGTTTQ